LAAAGISPRAVPLPVQPMGAATASSLPARPVPELRPSATPTSIAGEIKLVELQRDKLALELEVLKLRKASTADTTLSKDANDGVDPAKSGSTRKKHTIDWPHEFCPGAPINEFEKFMLTDFVTGFFVYDQNVRCPTQRGHAPASRTLDD